METLVSVTPTCRQSRANNLQLLSFFRVSQPIMQREKKGYVSLSCSGTPGDCGGEASEVPSCWQAFWVEEYLGGDPGGAMVLPFGPFQIHKHIRCTALEWCWILLIGSCFSALLLLRLPFHYCSGSGKNSGGYPAEKSDVDTRR